MFVCAEDPTAPSPAVPSSGGKKQSNGVPMAAVGDGLGAVAEPGQRNPQRNAAARVGGRGEGGNELGQARPPNRREPPLERLGWAGAALSVLERRRLAPPPRSAEPPPTGPCTSSGRSAVW